MVQQNACVIKHVLLLNSLSVVVTTKPMPIFVSWMPRLVNARHTLKLNIMDLVVSGFKIFTRQFNIGCYWVVFEVLPLWSY